MILPWNPAQSALLATWKSCPFIKRYKDIKEYR